MLLTDGVGGQVGGRLARLGVVLTRLAAVRLLLDLRDRDRRRIRQLVQYFSVEEKGKGWIHT